MDWTYRQTQWTAGILGVDIRTEMNATTTHGIIAMTAEECPDQRNAKTELESIHRWREKLLPDKNVYGTKSGEILDPFKVEQGRLRETESAERAQHVRARKER